MTRRDADRRARCLCALALAVSACAGETIRPGIPKEVSELRINPFEQHEDCLRMEPGDTLLYRFTAQRPVAFAIRYREGRTVIMPLSRDNAIEDDGIFRPLAAQDYCLVWDAGREGAILGYRILLRRTAP
jgi:hypothetical protein